MAIRGKAKASVIKLFSPPWNNQMFIRYSRKCGFLARETPDLVYVKRDLNPSLNSLYSDVDRGESNVIYSLA